MFNFAVGVFIGGIVGFAVACFMASVSKADKSTTISCKE